MTSSTSRPEMAARQTSSWLARKAGKPKVRASRSLRLPVSGEGMFAKRDGRDDWDMGLTHRRTVSAVEKRRPDSPAASWCGRVSCRAGWRASGGARRAYGRSGRVGFRNAATQPGAEDGLQRQQTDDQCEGKAECRREEVAHARTPPNGERPLFLACYRKNGQSTPIPGPLGSGPFLI